MPKWRFVASSAVLAIGAVAFAQTAPPAPSWYEEDGINAVRMVWSYTGTGQSVNDWTYGLTPGTPGADNPTLHPGRNIEVTARADGGIDLLIQIPNWIDNEPWKDFEIFLETDSLEPPPTGSIQPWYPTLITPGPTPLVFHEEMGPPLGFRASGLIVPNPIFEEIRLTLLPGPVPGELNVQRIWVWTQSVPEPGVLVTCALGGVLAVRRRR